MNLKRKLLLGFGISTAAATIASGFALHAIQVLRETANVEMQRSVDALSLVGKLNTSTANMRFAQRGIILYTLCKSNEAAAQHEALEREASAIRDEEQALEPLLGPEEKTLLGSYESGLQIYLGIFEGAGRLAQSGDAAATLREISQKVRPSGVLMQTSSADLEKAEREGIVRAERAIDQKESQAFWIEALMVVGSVAAALMLWIVIRGMIACLQRAASEVAVGSNELSEAATQIASTSNTLAQNASREATLLEETSASAEQISAVTRQTADRSKEAVRVMAGVDQSVAEANQSLSEMLVSMHDINHSSEQILKIIRVIEEIAFQTNILALNAAVEAARAGEAGMGFAVVADEVRNLAQRSAQAANDTTSLIEESITRSQQGSTRLEKVSGAICRITDSTAQIKILIDEIHSGSGEEARGVEQVSKAILDTQVLTQSTAASAQQGAASSEELNSQTCTLREVARSLADLIGA